MLVCFCLLNNICLNFLFLFFAACVWAGSPSESGYRKPLSVFCSVRMSGESLRRKNKVCHLSISVFVSLCFFPVHPLFLCHVSGICKITLFFHYLHYELQEKFIMGCVARLYNFITILCRGRALCRPWNKVITDFHAQRLRQHPHLAP